MLAAQSADAAFPGANGKIAFSGTTTGRTIDTDIYTMNADGSGRTRVTTDPAADLTPKWSPDGTRIAFARLPDLSNQAGEILVMNADGSNQVNLTNTPAEDDQAPAWSPDGTRIAFLSAPHVCSRTSPCAHDLYVMNSDGSGRAHVAQFNGIEPNPRLDWSASGDKLVFGATDLSTSAVDVYTIGPDGTGLTKLTTRPPGGGTPGWSPDGRRIAFKSSNAPSSFDTDIYSMAADGSARTQLTTTPENDYYPAWSPDGTEIAFERFGGAVSNGSIFVMGSDGSSPMQVSDFGSQPDWQPIPYTGYPRPRGASPLLSPLVPAYKQCSAPNDTHGAPLVFGSCNPPEQTSDYLTVGTPDSNGRAAGTVGSVRYTPVVGSSTSSADLKIAVNISGVLNKTALTPYSGELSANVSVRITDKNSTPSPGAATMVDIPFPVTVPCAGSLCAVSTTANAFIPGAITAGQRAIWELGQVQVSDGGADGLVATSDNTLFMDEGVFVP